MVFITASQDEDRNMSPLTEAVTSLHPTPEPGGAPLTAQPLLSDGCLHQALPKSDLCSRGCGSWQHILTGISPLHTPHQPLRHSTGALFSCGSPPSSVETKHSIACRPAWRNTRERELGPRPGGALGSVSSASASRSSRERELSPAWRSALRSVSSAPV